MLSPAIEKDFQRYVLWVSVLQAMVKLEFRGHEKATICFWRLKLAVISTELSNDDTTTPRQSRDGRDRNPALSRERDSPCEDMNGCKITEIAGSLDLEALRESDILMGYDKG